MARTRTVLRPRSGAPAAVPPWPRRTTPQWTVTQHRAAVDARVPRLAARRVPLRAASGRALAEDVPAAAPVPAFTCAAMDGYALRAADVRDAGPRDRVVLPVTADITAGRGGPPPLAGGCTHRVMTGAPLPAGADCVVEVELVGPAAGTVTFHALGSRLGGVDLVVTTGGISAGAYEVARDARARRSRPGACDLPDLPRPHRARRTTVTGDSPADPAPPVVAGGAWST